MAFFSSFAFGLIVYASYSASLTSFLAVFKLKMPFVGLRDMYENTAYRLGSLPGTAYDDLFKVG